MNVPTADGYWKANFQDKSQREMLREFAKLHVQAALEAQLNKMLAEYYTNESELKEAIENSYPLNLIK